MFDINDEGGSVRKKRYKSPIPADESSDLVRPVKGNKLDSERFVSLHKRLMDLYVRELERQNENRMEMANDADFYDNMQWREDDANTLIERGQVPLVYNVISATVDWVTGTEKRGRSDYKVLPRRKEDSKPAERKTQLLKYLSDVNKTQFDRSDAFVDAVKVGVGWLEDGVKDDSDGEPIYSRYETWRNIVYDSTANERDLSDGRYIFRAKWVDVDVAKAIFKNRKTLIDNSVNIPDSGMIGLDLYGDEAMDWKEWEAERATNTMAERVYGYQRRRVRLIEVWFRMPTTVMRMQGGVFSGEVYDRYSAGHQDALDSGESELIPRVGMRMHCAVMTPRGLVWVSESPYRHNRFPFTPIWGNRRDRDGLPYGIIRSLKSIQEDINKRASKALHILSSNKVVMDEGAVDDIDELAEEVARPDAIIQKKPGKELVINAERDLAPAHLEFMSRGISMIQQASGVTDELMGRTTNAKSGVAIERRQEQGSLATTKYFDNLRYAMQTQGEKQVSLIEQFMSEKKAFRITNMRGAPEFINVNDGLPENDVIRSKADFVISDADWRATMRQAAADQLMETITRFPPEVALVVLDLVVENMDLPNRDEIVRRIRSITGQRDPDADPNEITPEEQAQMQERQKQSELAAAKAVAELRNENAQAAEREAKAAKAQADTVRTNVESVGGPKRGTIDIAADLSGTDPSVAHTADAIGHELGLKGESALEDEAARMAAQQQAAQQQAAEEQAAQEQQQSPAPGIGQPGLNTPQQ